MGAGGVVAFVYAAKRDFFQDLEAAKYQVFWSDLEELVESGRPGTAAKFNKREPDGKDESAGSSGV